ncbi:maleylacetoacetate isomerase [Aureimonas endophytica]|uniref:Maleylacetoacetate isomerase n=1 Tax=Aureimonas endophytica TaxID=2027858 RepID=A0A917A2C9_9HYPH|nr:maleylacetoacetate isomerase [Aureimonas endophytica]GGE22009.1 maleylacetoacetate isomerase [Aureimonas endophytica]
MSDAAAYELYAYWRTSATYRVRVALALKGLGAEERFVDVDKGENRSPEFLKINPMGGLPAFVVKDGGAVLTQSLAILDYLEETHPEPALLPADALGRARVRSLAQMLAADTHPLITPRVRKYLAAEGGFTPDAWKSWQRHWFTTGLQAFEARLAADRETGRFCHGDQVTIADICLASITAVMKVFDINVAGIPTVERILAECEAMPAFAAADPFLQTGAPERAA